MVVCVSVGLETLGVDREMSPAARDYVVEAGYDPIYGARPLKRFLQSRVETMVAREIIAGTVSPGSCLVIDSQDGRLVLKKEEAQ